MNNRTRRMLHSSKSDEWETPHSLFNQLNEVFNFTLDPAASDLSHMCDKYYTKERNGLQQSWQNEVVFINPPYSKIGKSSQAILWCRKLIKEDIPGVMLLPARTGTVMWYNYVFRKATHIIFIKGRLKFINRSPDTKTEKNSAPFDSAIVIYKGHNYDLSPLRNLGTILKCDAGIAQ